VSVTPIRSFGDPVLRTPAEPVVDVHAELRRLVRDLSDTMLDAGGAGLPEHRREAMRIIRETDWVGGPPPVVRVSRHADAFGRR
jgi:Polypeptide deformylase